MAPGGGKKQENILKLVQLIPVVQGWPDINDVQTISLEKGDKKVHSEHRD